MTTNSTSSCKNQAEHQKILNSSPLKITSMACCGQQEPSAAVYGGRDVLVPVLHGSALTRLTEGNWRKWYLLAWSCIFWLLFCDGRIYKWNCYSKWPSGLWEGSHKAMTPASVSTQAEHTWKCESVLSACRADMPGHQENEKAIL